MSDAHATRPMTAEIDDPEDLEDAVVRSWLRHAPHFRYGKDTLVIASGILPPRWKPLSRTFASQNLALDFLGAAAKGGLANAQLRATVAKVVRIDPHWTREDLTTRAADALVHGELWVIRRNARLEKGRADPTVFAAINADYGTKVDFAFLAQWEGGQYLHGYVPFSKGIVAGASGMTIATGFDIGQKSTKEITSLDVPQTVKDKIMPFAAHKFRGLTHEQVVAKVLELKTPVPVITKPEADQLDRVIHAEHLAAAKTAWDGARKAGVPSFTGLPEPWQTVVFSRFFHQGKGANNTAVIKPFWTAATSGEWDTAVTALQNYAVTPAWYKTRVKLEAAHLKTQLPPPVVKPAATKPPAGKPPVTSPASKPTKPATPGIPPR